MTHHPRSGPSVVVRALATALLAAAAPACDGGALVERVGKPPRAGRVGEDPIPLVHLLENHSSALTAWRRAGVRDRVLLHLDGHLDLDWLPDETVARIAAARPEDMPGLELHPYAMDADPLSRFGIRNFVYPAARLGIVREMVWVVPDGTFGGGEGAADIVRRILAGRLHRMTLEEAQGLRFDGRVIRGSAIGLPLTVCEIADLPEIDEPVLLDVDLDYFTTGSAVTEEVLERPRIDPADVLRTLTRKGIRADVATLSLSTMGGALPPANRWLGAALQEALRAPGAPSPALGRSDRPPADASAWYEVARADEASGRADEARAAMDRAVALDPVLAHAALFEADRLWTNGAWSSALDAYRRYLAAREATPFAAHARRREADCLTRLDRPAEAIAALRRVIAMAPRHGDTRLALGVLLREEGSLDEAVAQLREARAILPDSATCAHALGVTYFRMGRAAEAIVELRIAVAGRPTWSAARGSLAAALAEAGAWDEARDHVEIALVLEPRSPDLERLREAIRGRLHIDHGATFLN